MKKLILILAIQFLALKAGMVDVWVEGGPKSIYTAGERLKINVISKVDGYLYLYNIDPNGRTKLIFPAGKPVYIHAGVHYVLPDDFYDDIEWTSSYDPGIEYIYAVVVPYPIYDMPLDCFEPLPPESYIYYDYDDIRFALVFSFKPPFWFPRVYFGAWTSYYIIPRYYVYHPAPWYCYDCHHPHVFIHFYFDFCPLYEIRVYEYRYIYVPRYIKYAPPRYRIRTRWEFTKEITPEKRSRLQEVEKETRIRVREIGIVEGKPVRDLVKEQEVKRSYEKERIRESKGEIKTKPEHEQKRIKETEVERKREYKEYEGKNIYESDIRKVKENKEMEKEKSEDYRKRVTTPIKSQELRKERESRIQREQETRIHREKFETELKKGGVLPQNKSGTKRTRR